MVHVKKFLSLALAFVFSAAMFAFPVAGTAAEAETTDFTADFNSETIGSSLYGGTVAVDPKTHNPCLSIADGQTATVTFSNNAQTVDFKLKAADAAKAVTVKLNDTAALTINGGKTTLAGTNTTKDIYFTAEQWYSVRFTLQNNVVKIYLDGRAKDYINNIDFATLNLSAASIDTLSVTGPASVDDVRAYASAQDGVSGLEASLLDIGFDGWKINSINSGGTITDFEYEPTKQNNTPQNAPLFTNLLNTMIFKSDSETSGLFGKGAGDQSGYLYHDVSTTGRSDTMIKFTLGKNAFLSKPGDTQVISFNMAFPEDASNRALTVRGRALYPTSSGAGWGGDSPAGAINIGKGSTTEANSGWIIRIQGDRVYFLGDETFYAIVPALTPAQWNNIRLEITKGDDVKTALTYKAYINDIEIVSNGSVAPDKYFVGSTTGDTRRFGGIYRLLFHYDWSAASDKATAGGFYLDDVKVKNYYGGGASSPAAVPERVASPLYQDVRYQRPENTTSEFPSTRELWDHDKWVTGNVVYVDRNMTLQQYVNQLDASRRIGNVIFRNSNGTEVTDLSSVIGDVTYMEVTDLNYERRTIGLIGKTKELSKFTENEINNMSTTIKLADVGKWINFENRATFQSAPAGGGASGSVVSMGQNIDISNSNLPSLRYSLSQRYTNSYRYDNADRYRPVTFEFSALMPKEEDGYLQMAGRYADGPSGANGLQFTTDKERSFIFLEKGVITAKGRKDAQGDSKILLGYYNPGEWNHFSVTYYPGIQTNRVDVLVNGGYSTENGTKHAFMLANREGRLQTIEEFIIYYRNNTDNQLTINSKVQLKDLKVTAGYYQPPQAPSLTTESGDLQISGKTVTLKKEMTASSLTTALQTAAGGTINGIYTDGTYGEKLLDTAVVNDGNKIVVQQGELLSYYTVEKQDVDIYQVDGGQEVQISGATVAPGKKVVVKAPASVAGQLFIAVYDEGRERLLHVEKADSTEAARASVSTGGFTLEAGQVIKIFYFSPDGELKPLMPYKGLTVEAAK